MLCYVILPTAYTILYYIYHAHTMLCYVILPTAYTILYYIYHAHTMLCYAFLATYSGWDKFCFTGGIVEISAQLPGVAKVGGLWPALWLMGNLARATYVGSSENLWPWSSDVCNRKLQRGQLLSACNSVNHYNLPPYQGRGAPEIGKYSCIYE